MRLLEVFQLLEDKVGYVVNAYGPRLEIAHKKDATAANKKELPAAEIVAKLATFDPTPNKKYLVWIAKLYADGVLRAEDLPKIPEELSLFMKVQPKLDKKDIMQYPTLPDLSEVLMPYHQDTLLQKSGKAIAKDARQTLIDNGSAVVSYSDADLKVVEVRTKEASCEFGKGTRWCTAAKNGNLFNAYAGKEGRGRLFILFPKKPDKNAPYQIHLEKVDEDDDAFIDAKNKFVIGMCATASDREISTETLLATVPSSEHFIRHLASQVPLVLSFELALKTKDDATSIEELFLKYFRHHLNLENTYPMSKFLDAFTKYAKKNLSKSAVIKIFKPLIPQLTKIIEDMPLNGEVGDIWRDIASVLYAATGEAGFKLLKVDDIMRTTGLGFLNWSGGNLTIASRYLKSVGSTWGQYLAEFMVSPYVDSILAREKTHGQQGNTARHIAKYWRYKNKKDVKAALQSPLAQQNFAKSVFSHLANVRDMPDDVHKLITDTEAKEIYKKGLMRAYGILRAKLVPKGELYFHPTTTDIKELWKGLGFAPAELAQAPVIEKSDYERAVDSIKVQTQWNSAREWVESKLMGDDDYIQYRELAKKLNYNWFAVSKLRSLFTKPIPASKFPENKDSFMAAFPNGFVIFTRNSSNAADPWVLQIPYKRTSTGSVTGKLEDTKLFKASTVSVSDSLKEDLEIIKKLFFAVSDDTEKMATDPADAFTESRRR